MTASAPKVTVIMSIYNGDRFLRSAIESILSQTYTDFEFLIIDDGSTDQTPAILSEYDDPRIKIITHKENIGLTRSLNFGLSEAKGQYIARMDADDISLPQRLKYQADFLDTHPDTALAGCNYEEIDEQDTPVKLSSLLTENLDLQWRQLFQNCFCHSAVMFRKDSIVSEGSYCEQITYSQDYDLWLRIARKNSIRNLPRVLHKWRRNRTSGISEVSYDAQQESAAQISCGSIQRLFPQEEINASALTVLRQYINHKTVPDDLCSLESLLMKNIDALWKTFPCDSFHIQKKNLLKGFYYSELAKDYYQKDMSSEVRRCLTKSIRHDYHNLSLPVLFLFIKSFLFKK